MLCEWASSGGVLAWPLQSDISFSCTECFVANWSRTVRRARMKHVEGRFYSDRSGAESIRARWYRDFLLQCEIDQRLAWHLDLVSLCDRFGTCPYAGTDARPDLCSFAASGKRADPGSSGRCLVFLTGILISSSLRVEADMRGDWEITQRKSERRRSCWFWVKCNASSGRARRRIGCLHEIQI